LFIAAAVVGLAIAIETYFQNERWPQIAALAVICGSALAAFFALSQPLVGGSFALDPRTQIPTGDAIPGAERLVALVLNVPGGLALALGAFFSAYIYMPKRRVLDYSLDAGQPGDHFLFNIFLALVAIPVNFVASLPGALVALVTGRIHSRVPATLFIASGAIVASSTDALSRLGSTELFQVGKLVGVAFIFIGFLISIEVFNEIRIPFTGRVLRGSRREHGTPDPASAAGLGADR
jgi:hypothetical protein